MDVLLNSMANGSQYIVGGRLRVVMGGVSVFILNRPIIRKHRAVATLKIVRGQRRGQKKYMYFLINN